MNTLDLINLTIDPWKLLGVPYEADDKEIEKAWENLSHGHRKNDTIRQAYQLISTQENRAQFRLLSPRRCDIDPGVLINEIPPKPVYSGPGIWYKSLSARLKEEEGD